MEATPATAADGELALHLYDLRREAEMRKARNWIGGDFWPRNFSELEQVLMRFGSQESAWFRQVLSYWDMAAALVLRGSLNPGLFFDTCGEAWFVYAKLKPFVQEARTRFNSPEFLANLERVIEGTAEGRERLRRQQENIARFSSMIEQQRKQQTAVSEAA